MSRVDPSDGAGRLPRCTAAAAFRILSRTATHAAHVSADDAGVKKMTSAGEPAEVLSICWSRRSAGANVAVAQVRRLLGGELVLLLQLSQPVLGVGRHRRRISRLQVEAVETGGVQAEDRL